MIDKKRPPLHITQYRRFVPYGTYSNPSFVGTSFILEPLGETVKEVR